MTERLLQFIWQFQYFNKGQLTTTTGETIQIIFPGNFNTDQGPDFSNAKIKIETTTLAGTIELHLKASGWKKHNHHYDKNYNNVILHVVWENDKPTTGLPVLELKERVSKILLQQYEELMNSQGFIPCEKSISTVRPIILQSWKERLLAERLIRKSKIIDEYLAKNNHHWEEAFWWLLARNFGMKINADAFEELARSIPIKILAKHKNQIHQLEALLFGQTGLLNGKFIEEYPKMLQREYKFLKTKYGLTPIHQPVFFLRMRPGNFPTVRLAQLAMLINESSHLFSKIKEAGSVDKIKKWFEVSANDYWHYHYSFDKPSPFKKKNPGTTMINNIIINSIAPVLFTFGHYHDEQQYKNKALIWLEEVKAENNSITKGFEKLGIENINARDSQALIELKNEYCKQKRCLDCAVGNAILKF